MQRQVWSTLLSAGLLVVGCSVPVLAQTQPALTYRPGYWQPVARVNPKSPVVVTFILFVLDVMRHRRLACD